MFIDEKEPVETDEAAPQEEAETTEPEEETADLEEETEEEEPVEEDAEDEAEEEPEEGEEPSEEEPVEEEAEEEEEPSEEPSAATQAEAERDEILKDLGYESIAAYRAQKAGKTVEEYTKEQEDQRVLEEARAIVQRDRAAKMISADLKALNTAFGLNMTSMKDMENPEKFVEYRTKNGLSAEDAFRLSNPKKATQREAEAAARKAAGKNHMVPAAGRTKSGESTDIPADFASYLKSKDPNITQKEIRNIYRRIGGR